MLVSSLGGAVGLGKSGRALSREAESFLGQDSNKSCKDAEDFWKPLRTRLQFEMKTLQGRCAGICRIPPQGGKALETEEPMAVPLDI